MHWLRAIVLGFLGSYGAELRFPVLFFVAAVLFVFNMALPDPVPFLDELILALVTAMLGSWKQDPPAPRPPDDAAEPIDVTARVTRVDPIDAEEESR